MSQRAVDPWGLVAALGRWYLVGFDHLSEEERMFRLDRIRSASLTDVDTVVPDDFNPDRYRGAFADKNEEPNLGFEISPEVSRWFEDYYPVHSSETLPDGWRRIRLISSGDQWSATLILRLGNGVRAVEPANAMERARELAGAISAQHSS
jgi:proteasome accessory factor C